MSEKPLKIIAGAPDRPLVIGDIEIPCYVLENETRVLSQRGMFLGLGASRGGSLSAGAEIPRFAAQKWIKPFISKELMLALKKPTLFQNPSGGGVAHGYPATMLVDICDAVLAAGDAGVLQKQQMHIAERCGVLMRGFARIGIIGLVDEATGYQEIRAKNALATILEKFIADEAQKWTKTFPIEFYKEIFRLRGWPWPATAHDKKPYTPQVIGRYTNDFVYDRLAPGVLDELRQRNPKEPKGERRHRHHQWFTPDFGHEKLKLHLEGVIALMRASPNWTSFKRNLARAYPKLGDQASIPLSDAEATILPGLTSDVEHIEVLHQRLQKMTGWSDKTIGVRVYGGDFLPRLREGRISPRVMNQCREKIEHHLEHCNDKKASEAEIEQTLVLYRELKALTDWSDITIGVRVYGHGFLQRVKENRMRPDVMKGCRVKLKYQINRQKERTAR